MIQKNILILFLFKIFSYFNIYSSNFNFVDSIIIATFIQQDKKAEMKDFYKNRNNFFMLLSDNFNKDNIFSFNLVDLNKGSINVTINFNETYDNPVTKIKEIKEKIYFYDKKNNLILEQDLKNFTVVVFKIKFIDENNKECINYIICNDCNSFEKLVHDGKDKEYIGLFQNFRDIKEITVEYISNNKSKWNIGENLFSNFKDLEKIDFKDHEYNFTNIGSMFDSCENLIKIDNIKSIFEKSEKIEKCFSLFSCCKKLEFEKIGFKNIKLPKKFIIFTFSDFKKIDLSSCIFSNVEKISFEQCDNLEEINLNINSDTKNLKNLRNAFSFCLNLKKLDLTKINVENVIDFKGIFSNNPNLEEVNLTGWNFNENIDICRFFENSKKLKKIIGLENIILKKIKNSKGELWSNHKFFFNNNKNLETLDLSTFKIEDFSEYFIGYCDIKTVILPNDPKSAEILIEKCLNNKENRITIKKLKIGKFELKDINEYDDLLRFVLDPKNYLDRRKEINNEIKQKLESLKNQDIKNIKNLGCCAKCFSNCCCCKLNV